LIESQGNRAEAAALHEAAFALAESAGETRTMAQAAANLGIVAHAQGEYGRATERYT